MGLFSQSKVDEINAIAKKSKAISNEAPTKKVSSINDELLSASRSVQEYFKDSKAILITTKEELHDYVTSAINSGYVGIDTETTGLDRSSDYIVGSSLYYPGGVECYIPNKHRIPIFEDEYKNQMSYEDVSEEFQRFVDSKTKLIFANANFDLYMIWKDFHIDLCPSCYYDVILAWRCLKEDELHNDLKHLYMKYPMHGKGDPKKFSDFFSPQLFPYCKPEIAKLYAANDAKITYELFKWQLPYVLKDNKKCQKNHLEHIADLIWNVEFPLISAIQHIERNGMYVDKEISDVLQKRYHEKYDEEFAKLQDMIQGVIDDNRVTTNTKAPFTSGKDFNPRSPVHVKYLVYTLMGLPSSGKGGTSVSVLSEFNNPVTDQIVKLRSLSTNINTFVDKLPDVVGEDGKIHADFKQIGASTGRMCIAEGTKIAVLNGQKNIEDIKPGDLVYCYDNNGELQLSKVKNLWLTGESRECVDITWQSSGKGDIGHLICTPEHNILMKSGEWVRADSLKRYDKLAHMRRTQGSAPDYRPAIYGWNGLTTREQDVVKYSVFHANSNFVIHHKDEDPSNNELSNLEVMSVEEHSRYHANKLISENRITHEHLHTKECVKKAHKNQNDKYVSRVKASKNQLLSMIKEADGRLTKIPMDFDSFKHRCKIAGIDYISECRKYNPRYYKERIPEDEFLSIYNKYNGVPIRITEYFHISYDKFYKYCDEYHISRNHMVQSVKPCGTYRVYDIEVENYHNFIANEICVHNSSASPNLQNIPSHLNDIRHMFRATPGYVMVGSDFSQQEPKLTAFVSQDPHMIKAFKEGKDIYASIASIAFRKPYEECLEFNPETGEYQAEGKARRSEAKTIVLGITYGRSVPSIGQQLYEKNTDMTDEEKTKRAQYVYDSVLNAFPNLRKLMEQSQNFAHKYGYVETVLGRRRHLPDMKLEEFEFVPMSGYVNPNVDPLDLSTLGGESGIPEFRVKELKAEFHKLKYFGQIAKRTKQLYEDEHIQVINNRAKRNDASRQCVNCVDSETEILTLNGWKHYNEIHTGDEILSYSLENNFIEKDKIQEVHINDSKDQQVYHIYNKLFDSVSTINHRWVMRNFDTNEVRFFDTSHILKVKRPRYHILRMTDVNVNEDTDISIIWFQDVLDSIQVNEVNHEVSLSNLSYDTIFKFDKNAAYHVRDFILDCTKNHCYFETSNEEDANKFQIICFMCGRVNNKYKHVTHRKLKGDNVVWRVTAVTSQRPLYQTARIDLMTKEEQKVDLTWCVTTGNGTWIARRNGSYYITGNSIIQGSAADMTKMAVLSLDNDPRWNEIGGRVLTIVHDEIIGEVPEENYKEAAKVLEENMVNAGSFLPFPIKCDVTVSYRWYGLEYPCSYLKPDNYDTQDTEGIKWIQYHLLEMEYQLPAFPDKNGNKPIGDAAKGLSGKRSDVMEDAISDYCNKHHISVNEFLDDIEDRVEKGIVIR